LENILIHLTVTIVVLAITHFVLRQHRPPTNQVLLNAMAGAVRASTHLRISAKFSHTLDIIRGSIAVIVQTVTRLGSGTDPFLTFTPPAFIEQTRSPAHQTGG
jgi:hypothetical protein